ncbi:MAG: sugar ABC transporter permease, partial [Chloroflexota bacterium]
LRVFDVFDLLVGERRFSMASYTQDVLIDGRMGYSSATGVVMFVIITVLVYFYLRTQQVGANDNG